MFPINKESILKKIKTAKLDPAVGIQISLLWEDLDQSYYGASISPHKNIAAHFHNSGDELYFVVNGNGVMRLGIPTESIVDWKQEFDVCGGDIFSVPPKTVHQSMNRSDDNLIVIFGCNKNHLGNDRIVVDYLGD